MTPVGTDGRLDSECQGELVARERRGELSHRDWLALRAHLADCASCRVTRQVYLDLDDASGVDVHDGVRIERMSNAARRFVHQRSHAPARRSAARRRLRTLGLAFFAVLIGGTASATLWFFESGSPPGDHAGSPDPGRLGRLGRLLGTSSRRERGAGVGTGSSSGDGPSPGDQPSARGATPPGSAAPAAIGTSSPGIPAPAETSAAAATTLGDRSLTPAHRGAAGHGLKHLAARTLPDDSSDRAAELLRQAGNARRAGDGPQAVRLYRRLQHELPESSEAVLSSVALGGLLLQQKSARAALIEFDAYLGSSRGGELVPEALYGRGRSLFALGDRQEERRTWQRLLADFPGSAYGPWARRRLADLE